MILPGETWSISRVIVWRQNLRAWRPRWFLPLSCQQGGKAYEGVDRSCESATGCTAGVDSSNLAFTTMELPLRTARKRQDPPGQVGTKHFCQQGDWHGEKSFKVGMIQIGDDNLYSSEEVVDCIGKQRVRVMWTRKTVFNKIRLKGTYLKRMCINKEMMRGQHDGRSCHTFSGNTSPFVPLWNACVLMHNT